MQHGGTSSWRSVVLHKAGLSPPFFAVVDVVRGWQIRRASHPLQRIDTCLALPSRNYHASHSQERHTVHGLQEHNSHEQEVPCGDGNNGCRLRSYGQIFHLLDKPPRDRQNL